MEYHVVVERLCKCAVRKGMPQIKTFDDRENAYRVARAWAQELNETFCGAHSFGVTEVGDNFVIGVGEGGARDAVQVFGGLGFITRLGADDSTCRVEQIYRDCKVAEIYEGANEIQKRSIARLALGRDWVK